MITFSQIRNYYGTLTNDSSAGNLTTGSTYINLEVRKVLGKKNWPFLEKTATLSLGTSTNTAPLPQDCDRTITLYQVKDGKKYPASEVTSRQEWDLLTSGTTTASYIQFFYPYGNQIEYWPYLSAIGTATLAYRKKVKDLSVTDYTTGSATVTNGSTTVTGSGGATWGSAMIGRYLQISEAVNGDHFFYEIQQVPSSTSLTLSYAYQGNTLSAVAYTIAQVVPLPENYQELPALRAAEKFWRVNGQNLSKAQEFKTEADDLEKRLERDWSNKTTSPVIDEGMRRTLPRNPNIHLESIG